MVRLNEGSATVSAFVRVRSFKGTPSEYRGRRIYGPARIAPGKPTQNAFAKSFIGGCATNA
jgi:hypothetical protein